MTLSSSCQKKPRRILFILPFRCLPPPSLPLICSLFPWCLFSILPGEPLHTPHQGQVLSRLLAEVPTSTLEPLVFLSDAMTALWPLLPGHCQAEWWITGLLNRLIDHSPLTSSLTDFLTCFLWSLFFFFSFQVSVYSHHSLRISSSLLLKRSHKLNCQQGLSKLLKWMRGWVGTVVNCRVPAVSKVGTAGLLSCGSLGPVLSSFLLFLCVCVFLCEISSSLNHIFLKLFVGQENRSGS